LSFLRWSFQKFPFESWVNYWDADELKPRAKYKTNNTAKMNK